MSEAAPQDKIEVDGPDMSFIRDFVDIIKNKMLFFFPFFGAFLVFVFTKSDYVANSYWTVKLLCAASFFVGIWYAYNVSQALWLLESTRLAFTLDKTTKGHVFAMLPDDQREAIRAALSKIGPIFGFEDKLFRRTMYLLYLTAASVLFDIYFGKFVQGWTAALSHWVLSGK
jgi:hypothetical protein